MISETQLPPIKPSNTPVMKLTEEKLKLIYLNQDKTPIEEVIEVVKEEPKTEMKVKELVETETLETEKDQKELNKEFEKYS